MQREDVGADPALEAMAETAHLEIHGLLAAERLLDLAPAVVGPDRLLGREFVASHIGAEDADAVESGLGGNARCRR